MSDLCRKLDWDSRHFSIEIAEITVPRLSGSQAAEVMEWSVSKAVRCLYWLVDPNDSKSFDIATSNSFRFADVRMNYGVKLSAAKIAKPLLNNMTCRFASHLDGPSLALIAEESHRDTRFYFDPQFDREKCRELYRMWICNSVAGFADAVFVIVRGHEIAGYVTCKKTGACGRIGLLAVERTHRGLGVGQQLVSLALNYFSDMQAQYVEVSTSIRNLAAQRLYVRCGLLPSDNFVWFHRWFDVPGITPITS